MSYRQAADFLDSYSDPRRKYAPLHWLVSLYFFGRRIGALSWRMWHRNPFVYLWRGVRDSWE